MQYFPSRSQSVLLCFHDFTRRKFIAKIEICFQITKEAIYKEIKIVITCNMEDILKELCDRFEGNQIILIYEC